MAMRKEVAMADITFRLFRSTRFRPTSSEPTPLEQFVQRVDRETNGPTDDLVRIYQTYLNNRPRRRA
jgi:hypothetical protein